MSRLLPSRAEQLFVGIFIGTRVTPGWSQFSVSSSLGGTMLYPPACSTRGILRLNALQFKPKQGEGFSWF